MLRTLLNIVDSAGGSLKKGRDSNIQAILPVFGKILNVLKATLAEVIKSPKIIAIIKSIKCGFKEEYDITKLRYHKLIVGSDADKKLFALTRNSHEKKYVNCGKILRALITKLA